MWPPSCGADGLYPCSTHLGELKPQWRPESFLTGVIYVRTKALLPGFLTGAVWRTAVVAGRRESKALPQSQSPTFKPFPPRKQGPQIQSHDPSCSGTTVGRELEKKVRIPRYPREEPVDVRVPSQPCLLRQTPVLGSAVSLSHPVPRYSPWIRLQSCLLSPSCGAYL